LINHLELIDLLVNTYGVIEEEAEILSDFLLKALEIYPEKRAKAVDLLNHPWLKIDT
jgi:serine/threonine protein kinase